MKTDAELVKESQAGDAAALDELVTRHERRVYTLALRIVRNERDAEDVTQQAFLSMIDHLGEFRSEAAFSTWLSRIALNAAFKVLRTRKSKPFISLDEETEADADDGHIPHPEYIADWRNLPDIQALRGEMRGQIEEALATLDEKHRAVFLLRDVEGFSVRETAETLHLSEANVKVRLLRARLQLREILTRLFADPSTRMKSMHPHPKTLPAAKKTVTSQPRKTSIPRGGQRR